MITICGIHAIREALQAGHPLEYVVVAQGAAGTRMQEIIDLCRRKSIPVRFEERHALDLRSGTSAHQGVVAVGAAHRYRELADIAGDARLVVVLDGVEDPHNLGAILRSAEAAGADAVVIPERRAVGLTDVVAKVAAGALEYVSVVRVTNINRALEELKAHGFWIYGLDQRSSELYSAIDYATPTALVLGGEGKGLHEHVRKHCDTLLRIPMAGRVSSLNVSVAAGVVLFEWRRRHPR